MLREELGFKGGRQLRGEARPPWDRDPRGTVLPSSVFSSVLPAPFQHPAPTPGPGFLLLCARAVGAERRTGQDGSLGIPRVSQPQAGCQLTGLRMGPLSTARRLTCNPGPPGLTAGGSQQTGREGRERAQKASRKLAVGRLAQGPCDVCWAVVPYLAPQALSYFTVVWGDPGRGCPQLGPQTLSWAILPPNRCLGTGHPHLQTQAATCQV